MENAGNLAFQKCGHPVNHNNRPILNSDMQYFK